MADVESIREHLLAAKSEADKAYELALELHAIIAAFGEIERAPTWAFPLERMALRVRDQADVALMAVLKIPGVLELLRSAPEASS